MKSNKKRLVLLDAHAIIHRAYHAIPDLTAPDGSPAGALYGLSSMLIRIIGELSPDYIAACYDLPKPTIRHEAYTEYKGTRSKIEDALIAQLKTSRDVFAAFSIPIYEKEGFEADDLLGTIPELLRDDKELEIIIASGDMDCLQLVEDGRVKIYTLKKGITDVILYDEKAVKERYGFSASQITDYKGLRGDTSDNIKGVPGIGEKIATELLAHFGSIENIYTILKKDDAPLLKAGIKPRIIGLLKEHEEDAQMSKSLATIRRDAPIMFRLPDTKYQDGARLPAILALFDTLGFRSLKQRAQTLLWHETDGDSFQLPEEDKEEIEEIAFKEAQVMLWLLVSDFTNPTLDDILAFTKKDSFKEAYSVLETQLTEAGRVQEVYEKMERPLIPLIARMHERGVAIDRKALQDLQKTYGKELEQIAQRIYAHAGHEFNVSSPKQLGTVLFDELELVTKGQKKTAGGQRSTKESELEKIQDLHPIVKEILEYREVQKLLSTYIESILSLLDSEGKLHAQFLQTGTVTGRMGCANPNLQNIPIRSERGRVIRNAFVASKGYTLLALDYSQIELRLAAILSGDEKLCAIFRSGRDVHQEVAAAVFGVAPDAVDREMRRRAKVINFGILYGMGVNALRAQLGSTVAEAHQFYDDYFATFKRLAEYLEETRGFARKHGYTETLFGRRRQFPEMKSPLPYVRAQAERMAINAPIQGTEADIIKLAMVQVEEFLAKNNATEDAHLLLQVHDELVYEIKTERLLELGTEIKKIMEVSFPEAQKAGVPIQTEGKTGINWGVMESL